MKSNYRAWPALGVLSVLQLAIAQAYAAPLALGNSPLFLGTATKANVLMMYGNSNSMDSDPTGKAVGSGAPSSKSEVARAAIKSVVDGYTGYLNMGLMAYQQNVLVKNYLHDSQYDVSYDPANYDPAFSGARNSLTKKFRIPNPSDSGKYLYFNVNLPYYADDNQGNAFCYALTACTDPTHDFKGTADSSCSAAEHPVNGGWDVYNCFKQKTGTSNGNSNGSNGANGYAHNLLNGQFNPTDSDLGQGITDFGKRIAWQAVSLSWFNNTSPGMGYVHVPVAALDADQAARINTKLGTSQFIDNKPTDPAYALQNGGLSPLEGAVLTANRYFAGTLSAGAQGGPLAAPPNSCSKNFLVTLTDGLPSVTKDGVASANMAQNLSGLTAQVAALRASSAKAETYVVGFALPYGVSITQLDSIAAAGGSGTAYNASDTATLNAAFANIFADIISKTSAASSVALNSQSVATDAHVYQAKFSSGDWSGQLLDFALQSDGSLGAVPLWDAGRVINGIAPAARVIITGNGSKGVPFRWPGNPATPTINELSAAQVALLKNGASDSVGSERLDYLRGVAANEGVAGLKWRARPTSKLGDIVNSAPHFVGVPAFNYGEPSYATFRASQAGRSKMIYAGANDGMLHGFDASNGVERLAYIPSAVYPNLSRLSEPNYAHRYFVDGSPNSGDVFFGGSWHTMLVSGLGGGGRGIFALDVTDPANFTEANAAGVLKFEFADANLGLVPGPIDIVKLNNGRWAALFGNGYNSADPKSALYIVDIETGALIRRLATDAGVAGTPNALATPLSIDTDSDTTVDVVYAGDLLGNMWKFDLSAANPSQWRVAYKLFQAGQPITSAPDAGEHPNGGYMVYFGTGKYLETGDISSTPGNAMYGIWDKGVETTVAQAELVQQVFTGLNDINGVGYRTATANPINWASKKGWYASFPDLAERMVSTPVLRGGRVIFTSIIPSSVECSPGGSSWLNEVDWLTGGLLAVPPLDTNGDGKVNSSDTLVQGRRLDSVASAPAIQNGPRRNGGDDPDPPDHKMLNQSSGTIANVTEGGDPKQAKRLSWRQLK